MTALAGIGREYATPALQAHGRVTIRSFMPRLVVALSLLSSLACAPASSSEAAPLPQPSSTPTPDPTTEPEPVAEPEPEPEPAPPPEPEIADSNIQAKLAVDPSVAAGLQAFAAELAPGGSLWIGKLEGNGGRDVLIYIPPGADNAAPFELVFHFHGTYSETFAKPEDGKEKREWVGWDRLAQTLEAIAELQAKHPYNVAVIYPFSAGRRLEPGHKGWSNAQYDRMWMDGAAPPDYRDDFARLWDESLAVLRDEFGVHPSKLPRDAIVEGHSAGGIALLNIARHGSAHVREYIFLDASFQSWADGCYAAIKDSGAAAKLTLVVTKKGIADPFHGRDPWCVDMQADAQLWPNKQAWCASRPDEDVPGTDWTCAELEQRAQEWKDDYADWCAAYQGAMQSIPEVTLIETKVVHGKQPRHFAGGLELAADRWTEPTAEGP
jgi:pimeloyl-ACP methyl ester carboxylesterase